MTEPYRVPAVQAAVKVLHALEERRGGAASQAELARETEIPKSTMHNLLRTLSAEGLVRRSEPAGDYVLGGALIHLGAAAARNTRPLANAIDSVAPLTTELGLSFAVAQPIRPDLVQVVERFYPPQDVHVGVTIGASFGPFDGALGKCLLAALPQDEAESVVRASQIPARTDRTITDPLELLAEVDTVRERGWAGSRQEYNENNAVAALITGPSDRAEAFIVALGFANQLPASEFSQLGGRLAGLAREAGSGRRNGFERGGGPSAAGGTGDPRVGVSTRKTSTEAAGHRGQEEAA
ncbi:MAG: IclR family transcriptional regulator [Solirubrobacterales bacterium]